MYIEFCIYHKNYSNAISEDIQSVFDSVKYGVKGVNVPSYFLKKCPYIDQVGLTVSVPIDYPNGIRDRRLRQVETIFSLRSGANAIDLVINPFLITEKKYIELRSDLDTHKKICDDYGATLRPIINYDLFNTNQCLSVAKCINELGIEYVLPSAGYKQSDIYDTILISSIIKEQFQNLNIILTGHMWNDNHVNLLKDTTFFGVRTYSVNFLKKIV